MTRFFRMTRKAVLSTIAAAVAATSITATPASAGNDDLAKALLGIGAIAIIGTAIANESRADDRKHEDRDRNRGGWNNGGHNGGWNNGGHNNGGWNHNSRPRPARKTIASRCEVRTWVNGYRAIGYRAACAQKTASRPQQLPQACRQRTDIPKGVQGPKVIYRKVCMQKRGWVTT